MFSALNACLLLVSNIAFPVPAAIPRARRAADADALRDAFAAAAADRKKASDEFRTATRDVARADYLVAVPAIVRRLRSALVRERDAISAFIVLAENSGANGVDKAVLREGVRDIDGTIDALDDIVATMDHDLESDPVARALLEAPPDDEPYTDDQRARDTVALEQVRRGGTVSALEVARRLGIE
jgi:hypothetical protein